jgi:hypothetical protein
VSLQIVAILDRGKANLERIEFHALTPVSLAYYVVLHTTFAAVGETVASGGHPAFWFPTVQVAAGERVVLYTRGPMGLELSQSAAQRTFYWGLSQTLWNTPADTAVLVQASGWQTAQRGLAPLGNLGNLGNLFR